MTSIEEYTERMDLLQKTAMVEAKQKKRIMELQAQKQKELQEEKMLNLLSAGTSSSILQQEENQRKMLADSMVKSANPSTTPIVRVLNNVQGIRVISSMNFIYFKKGLNRYFSSLNTFLLFFFLFTFLGTLGKMRRNDENCYAIIQASYTEIQDLKNGRASLEAKVDVIKHHVLQSRFQKAMSGPDMSEFFPVQKQEQLINFLDRTHPQWEARRDEFYNLLFTIATNNKSCFSKGLFKTLFSRTYIVQSKWPSYG